MPVQHRIRVPPTLSGASERLSLGVRGGAVPTGANDASLFAAVRGRNRKLKPGTLNRLTDLNLGISVVLASLGFAGVWEGDVHANSKEQRPPPPNKRSFKTEWLPSVFSPSLSLSLFLCLTTTRLSLS